jgi:1-acyl-sn-glycerol-3-phosphate acyltransferase
MTFLRSALFLVWLAVISVVINLAFVPALVLPRGITVTGAKIWATLVLWGLRWIVGLSYEVRGPIPKPPVLIAAKHLSMWETIAFLALLPDPAIVMKRSLLRVPFYGWYCRKMGMIAIDREAGAKAIRVLYAAADEALRQRRPIVIFPEGTRKRPGAPPDYKPGVAALYAHLDVPCVPAALNSGLFWVGRFSRLPGTVILEFLEPIPPGLPRGEFMVALESRIEGATRTLLAARR